MTKKATVTITATRLPAAPWVHYEMAAKFPDKGGSQDGDKLKFDAKEGPFELVFDLDDQTKGLKLGFLPSFAEAMWVAPGTSCPQGPGNGGGAISAGSVNANKLVVNNANAIDETLTFALRFTGIDSPGGFPPYVYDPIIINGGGSINQR